MALTMTDIFEKHGLTGELIFENAVRRLIDGQASVEEAMDYIMEFARGGWSLVVDENLHSLADALADLNYGVKVVPRGMSDADIRDKYASRGVFITSDTGDFSLPEVPDPFEDGMILVPNGVDEERLARAVERVLMTWRKTHKAAPVAARIGREDL